MPHWPEEGWSVNVDSSWKGPLCTAITKAISSSGLFLSLQGGREVAGRMFSPWSVTGPNMYPIFGEGILYIFRGNKENLNPAKSFSVKISCFPWGQLCAAAWQSVKKCWHRIQNRVWFQERAEVSVHLCGWAPWVFGILSGAAPMTISPNPTVNPVTGTSHQIKVWSRKRKE